MSKAPHKESYVKSKILMDLGAHPDLMLFNNPTGTFFTANGTAIRINRPGAADVIGIWRRPWGGQAIAIEVKTETGRQSPDQKIWQSAWERAGGIYVLARSTEDVLKKIPLG
jgi:hypothetical protein